MKELCLALCSEIKKKKELHDVNDAFVMRALQLYFKTHPSIESNPRSASFKHVVKIIRADLRRKYGLFRQEKDLILLDDFVKEYCRNPSLPILEKILSIHASTRERLPIYKQLYSRLFKITGKPQRVLDIGCGLNPFSVHFMALPAYQYFAYDISENEIKQLNTFFALIQRQNPQLQGNAIIADFFHLPELPAADLALLFKVADILDQGRGHKATEAVLKALPARWIVISFSTTTMSGKKMTAPRRNWMEWLCQRLGYQFQILEFPNEIFYVIKK